jgi:prepilin-type N-terminal cleavage/methylation domain-containing protein
MTFIPKALMVPETEKIRMISRIGNRRAFTLVEMLVVLAIMAMIMAISVPFTSGFGKGLKIKTAARAIVGIMRVARSNAVTFRKNYSVVFDVKKGRYWIEDDAGRVYEKKYYLPSSVRFEVKGDDKIDPITFENDRLTFKSSGSIEGPSGSVTITDKQGGSRIISAAETTGKVTIN